MQTNTRMAKPTAFHTIVFGGMAIGILDWLDATIFFTQYYDVALPRIWQSVAAGILGLGRSGRRRLVDRWPGDIPAFRHRPFDRFGLFRRNSSDRFPRKESDRFRPLVRRYRSFCYAVRCYSAVRSRRQLNVPMADVPERSYWACLPCRPPGRSCRCLVCPPKPIFLINPA